MKKTRSSEFRNQVTFYRQSTQYNEVTGVNESVYTLAFKRWAKVKVIFREQLESVVSGGNTLRDRLEFTVRYCTDIDSTMRCEYKGLMYNISIVGEKPNTPVREEISFLGETVRDGGE